MVEREMVQLGSIQIVLLSQEKNLRIEDIFRVSFVHLKTCTPPPKQRCK
jgi:hypothetical protein